MAKVREDYDRKFPSVWSFNQILTRINADEDDAETLVNLFEEARRFEAELKTLRTLINKGLGANS